MPKSPPINIAVRFLVLCKGRIPMPFKRAILNRIKPKQAASLICQSSVEPFSSLTQSMPMPLIAQVVRHLNPQVIRDDYMALPEEFHIDLTQELCSIHAFSTAADFTNFLSAAQLKVLFFALNSEANVVSILEHMKNLPLVGRGLRGCSTSYLSRLAEEAGQRQRMEAVAQVIGMLSMQRQAAICASLSPAALMQLLPQLLLLSNDRLSRYLPPKLLQVIAARSG
ncbi:hypothetical protein [Pseudomonas sp. M30-35]|uniref:hypothetical protein n=1 Tax=Pseudomonas sp. M30-35 TaxID=1981174 RepID=UPI000B3C0A14|nr:hypothetical protein [Pseudomonas sp. M30-35]ARU90495.1 hypothetical protein B9K09_22185 [Pseudomonas sp. M30-35]